jgi:hypothetical protein
MLGSLHADRSVWLLGAADLITMSVRISNAKEVRKEVSAFARTYVSKDV